jgi:pSer/pThr/pTyr-binding forkhead associated (FHA) protein
MGIRKAAVEQVDGSHEAAKPAAVPPTPLAGNGDSRDEQTESWLPSLRPPVPILWILDDGQQTGEAVRVRKTPWIIGRSQGDVRIVHDDLMSDPHAGVVWRQPSFVVQDLKSASGVFVRVVRALLTAGQEIRVGRGCYRFEDPGQLVAVDRAAVREPLRWVGKDAWVGRDPGAGGVLLADDPTLNARHARLVQAPSGCWYILDNHSRNGIWLRMPEIAVDSVMEFLLGEQRFELQIPGRRESGREPCSNHGPELWHS